MKPSRMRLLWASSSSVRQNQFYVKILELSETISYCSLIGTFNLKYRRAKEEVCVSERERERDGMKERDREKERERDCVCVVE